MYRDLEKNTDWLYFHTLILTYEKSSFIFLLNTRKNLDWFLAEIKPSILSQLNFWDCMLIKIYVGKNTFEN